MLSQIHERIGGGGAFLMIDEDHFKSVNDSYGHDMGDEALKCIAIVLRTALPAEALVGSLGGEEFGAFLPRGVLREGRAVQRRWVGHRELRGGRVALPEAPAPLPNS
ncbi:GGDEF domain-containing protein [Rhizobium laguerreae]|uniref:GGDEF domain-containing protein n=1 Tax=Rhizobium laguerreae TaxID=1076926 RepID=UPI001C923274|nr:GGDEF domain-containing protein [Rhizobium laguerreae]MBY3088879.1 GGDEF domain-containing protein [Rhizobium laguerreae]MBY3150587.1 GGDEF domain-containing protein [Rhizobium laguerreae]